MNGETMDMAQVGWIVTFICCVDHMLLWERRVRRK